MSRARHAKKAEGGGVKPAWNAGEEQNAAKEAEERKHGGKIVHGEGERSKHRGDRAKRARGGHVMHKVKHHSMKHAMGGADATDGHKGPSEDGGPTGSVKYRASGGRLRGEGAGADRSPLTTASRVKHITSGEDPEKGIPSG